MKAPPSKRVDEAYKLATKAMIAKNWQKAVGHWTELRKSQPQAVSAYAQAARALIHLDRTEEAEVLLQEGMQKFPKNAAIAMRYAMLPEHRKDWSLAITRWRNFHDKFRGTAHSFLQHGRALVHAGHTDEAESLLIEAEKHWPDDKLIAVNLAEIAVNRRDWGVVLERWRTIRERFEDSPKAFQGECEALIELSRFDEAEEMLQMVTTRYPDHPVLVMRRAMVAMYREDWTTACERWEAFRQRFAGGPEAYEQEAESLTQAGQLDKAERLLQEAIKRFPNRRKLALKLAQIASQRQDWAQAAERWKVLRKRFKATVECYKGESHALAQLERREEAESLLGLAVKRWPRNKSIALELAEYAMTREDWETASQRWTRICRDFPDTPKAYFRGMQAHINLAQLDQAEALLQDAVARFPQKPEWIARMTDLSLAREENETLQQWQLFYTNLLATDSQAVSAVITPLQTSSEGTKRPSHDPDDMEPGTMNKPIWKRLLKGKVISGRFTGNRKMEQR